MLRVYGIKTFHMQQRSNKTFGLCLAITPSAKCCFSLVAGDASYALKVTLRNQQFPAE
jgi:hypothetical protein